MKDTVVSRHNHDRKRMMPKWHMISIQCSEAHAMTESDLFSNLTPDYVSTASIQMNE